MALDFLILAQSRPFEFMTREVFDTLIIVVVIIGLALAIVRLYRDFTRPLPHEEDTQPNFTVEVPRNAPQDDDQRNNHD